MHNSDNGNCFHEDKDNSTLRIPYLFIVLQPCVCMSRLYYKNKRKIIGIHIDVHIALPCISIVMFQSFDSCGIFLEEKQGDFTA